jgi:hypothetical protein
MKKKNSSSKNRLLNIGIFIVVLGVIFLILGIVLFDFDSLKSLKNTNEKTTTKEDSFETEEVKYETEQDVLEAINLINQGLDVTITYDHEENGCWYYTSSNSLIYEYCKDENEIKISDPNHTSKEE